ncbi:M64 family metallopeptidase [Mariniflexile sp.]|uniref:M64 family metallopeptidase n=1 Tax=Mariniflexile sp. TaxID=1979402 RepID=UPI004047FB57
MKQLLYIILLVGFQNISAQIFNTETIKNSGDNDKRINLVILSEGYQTPELPQFKTDAINFVNAMFSQSPFKEYANYFNVHIIKVPSNDSGADHPGTSMEPLESTLSPVVPIKMVNTYFNAAFDSYGYHRLLFYEIDGNYANNTEVKINSVLADNFPTYDQALILVNSAIYGGSGGEFPMASKGVSNGVSSTEIAIHELGHSMFNLKDEYFPLDEIYFSEAINMTQQNSPSLVKWKNWLGTNGVGTYQYNNSGFAASWYRPHQACKMRYLSYPFCAVCKEGIVEKIHSLVSPIDAYAPASNSISNPTFPIDFHLNLIKPVLNTLKSTWTLNTANFANDVDVVSVLETDLTTGMNSLTVTVNDDTAMLKVDNHDTFHVYTVTWTIDNSILGVTDITGEVANYSISMYPNPATHYLNISTETTSNNPIKMDIISLEGKLVKSVTLSNFGTQQIDVSYLSQGVYITNFYSGNLWIASKKIIKN